MGSNGLMNFKFSWLILEVVLKKYLSDYLFLFIIAGVVIALDQWTKSLVRANLAIGQIWVPWEWLAPYARIVHWKNSGAAFGMFQNLTTVFMILPFIVAGLIIYYFPQIPRQDWPLRTALSLQMGGALGNLIDRLARGGEVTDFISVGNFPVFNVADSSISIGVAVLIIGMWIQERRFKAIQAEAEGSPPETEISPRVEEIISE
jgi:signal peptidase II